MTRRDSTVIADAATLTGDVIGSLGASIYDSEQFDAAVRDPRITVVQIPCNILDRHIDDRRLMAARDSGTAVYARSVLLQGILVASPTTISGPAARLRPAVEEFHRLATALGRPPLELALGWVRHRPGVQRSRHRRGLDLGARCVDGGIPLLLTRGRRDSGADRHRPARSGAVRSEAMVHDMTSPSTPTGSQATHGRVVAVVQARLGSVRLPAKVLAPIIGRPALGHLVDRLGRAVTVDEIVLAIPDSSENDSLADFAVEAGLRCVRGSERDVLDRFRQAADAAAADYVVRITGDCPLVDPGLVDTCVSTAIDGGFDYASTGVGFPDGFDVEVFAVSALDRAAREAEDRYDREHVTPFLRRDEANRTTVIDAADGLSGWRVTLDEPEDLEVIRSVFEHFGDNLFTFDDVTDLMSSRPELFTPNMGVRRNEGASMGTGQKLWQRATRVIPGGNMLLSKRPEMHLPRGWPAYYSRSSGCRVWDLDDNELIDVGLMGVGTNILGYGHPKVDAAVHRVIDAGNMSTLNCPEEVALAEKLVGLHPWADMARFARSGGEACAIAVRIARASAGRSAVAFCGYHGWHDWYLSANLAANSALDGHLLPGLEPAGVPREMAGLSRPFAYNDLDALESILLAGDVGVVFMEVVRSSEPEPGFLEGVRSLADQHGAVLIFDECTSGFRRTVGGLHLSYGVEPDVAVFGKTLGNGYAISAVVGREAIMQAAQDTFISSTFWTERIGPAAAVTALEVMEEENAPDRVNRIGLDVRRRWIELGHEVGLPVETGGVPALGSFSIRGMDPVVVKTFVTQEMLARGFIAGTVLYASIAHDDEVLDAYIEALTPVFQQIADSGVDRDAAAASARRACSERLQSSRVSHAVPVGAVAQARSLHSSGWPISRSAAATRPTTSGRCRGSSPTAGRRDRTLSSVTASPARIRSVTKSDRR